MNYATLARRVTRALVREDIDAEEMQAWVRSATTRLNRELRVREMLSHRVLPLAAARFAAPLDFLHTYEIRLAANPAGEIREGMSRGALIYASPAEIAVMAAATRYAPGAPGYYTMHGAEIEVAPYRGTDSQVSLWYFAKLRPPQADDETNAVLENFEDLYLKTVLVFGFRFYLEMENSLAQESLVSQEIAALNRAFEDAKYGDGPLVMRPARRIGGRYS